MSQFQSNPRITNSITGFSTFSLGDVLSQNILNDDKPVDYKRAVCTGCLGIVMNGVVLHHWYNILDKSFGKSMQSKKAIFLKMFFDQLIYAPFSIAVFYAFAAAYVPPVPVNSEIIFELNSASVRTDARTDVRTLNEQLTTAYDEISNWIGNSASTFEGKMRESFASVWLADCCIWPFVNFINFSYVPKNYRPSFVGVAQLVWQTYVSSQGHKHVHVKVDEKVNKAVDLIVEKEVGG